MFFGDASIATQVKGKPILLLCNKADMDQAQVRHSSSPIVMILMEMFSSFATYQSLELNQNVQRTRWRWCLASRLSRWSTRPSVLLGDSYNCLVILHPLLML